MTAHAGNQVRPRGHRITTAALTLAAILLGIAIYPDGLGALVTTVTASVDLSVAILVGGAVSVLAAGWEYLRLVRSRLDAEAKLALAERLDGVLRVERGRGTRPVRMVFTSTAAGRVHVVLDIPDEVEQIEAEGASLSEAEESIYGEYLRLQRGEQADAGA